jgi:hypothetical protein
MCTGMQCRQLETTGWGTNTATPQSQFVLYVLHVHSVHHGVSLAPYGC